MPKKPSSSSQKDTEKGEKGFQKISWGWLSNQKTKNWTAYDSGLSERIETAYKKYLAGGKDESGDGEGSSKFKVDEERYLDFQKLQQIRYDDNSKRRPVARNIVDADDGDDGDEDSGHASSSEVAVGSILTKEEVQAAASTITSIAVPENEESDSEDDSDGDEISEQATIARKAVAVEASKGVTYVAVGVKYADRVENEAKARKTCLFVEGKPVFGGEMAEKETEFVSALLQKYNQNLNGIVCFREEGTDCVDWLMTLDFCACFSYYELYELHVIQCNNVKIAVLDFDTESG